MVGSFYSTEKESEKEGKEWFDRVKERSEGGGEFEDVVEFALATRGEFPIKRWFYGARDSAFALGECRTSPKLRRVEIEADSSFVYLRFSEVGPMVSNFRERR